MAKKIEVFVVKSQMIGCDWQVFSAYVVADGIIDPKFGTIYCRSSDPLEGHEYFGQVGTYTHLPDFLERLPSRTAFRVNAVTCWQKAQQRKSVSLIYLAYPELWEMKHQVTGFNIDTFEPRPKKDQKEYRKIIVPNTMI